MTEAMAARTEIRLAGEGGQGMILAGIILAEAASIYDGKMAVQTQSYGPEARGGASKSEVVIAAGEIDHPEVLSADVVVTLSQEAYDKYAASVKPGGLLIVDDEKVSHIGIAGGHQDPDQPAGLRNNRESHHRQYGGAGRAGGVDGRGLASGHRKGRHGARPARHRGDEPQGAGGGFEAAAGVQRSMLPV